MHSVPIDIFFSCSFAATDKDINDFFLAICKALTLHPSNVSTGSSRTPPNEAKDKIERAQAVVAVCPRRGELKGGGFVMPAAVHDEISFAFGSGTPILMIIEDGVDFSGFKSNFGTYLKFERDKIHEPGFIEKAVEAIHNLKLVALGDHQVGSPGPAESHAEYINHLIELRPTLQGLTWKYSTLKKLVYSQPSKRSFPIGVWAVVPVHVASSADNIEWRLTLRSSSRNIELEQVLEKHTPSCVEARVKLNPPAEEGDFVEYYTEAMSPYINPIWLEDVAEGGSIHLNNGSYKCADGLIFIHRTKKATIEFRFGMECGITRADLRPFVGSYSSAVDYEVESELKRADVRFEDFGGTVVVRLEIDSPLPGHMYGVAWNPKPKPAQLSSLKTAVVGSLPVDDTDQTKSLIGNPS